MEELKKGLPLVASTGICLQKEIKLESGFVNFRGRMAFLPFFAQFQFEPLFFPSVGREEQVVGVGNKMTGRLHLLSEISQTLNLGVLI